MPESSHREDIVIATAALLGGNPVYYDFGHPERAIARRYWAIQWFDEASGIRTIYGYTRYECAHKWLCAAHPEVELPRR